MADFALWAKAAEPAFGWGDDEFIKAYGRNQNEAVAAGIDASPVGTALLALMAERDRWSGKPTELLAALEDIAGERQAKSRAWPQSTKGLANILKRLAPPLRKVGVEVTKLASGSLGRPYIIPELVQIRLLAMMPTTIRRCFNDCRAQNHRRWI